MFTKTQSVCTRRHSKWMGLLALCFGLSSMASHADESDPASRVARISFLRGQVYVQTSDDDSWNDATINRPLTNGDQLWTDNQGRSELQMGSTTVQVDANTQLRIEELSDNELQLVVTQGLINVRVRNLDRDDHIEISTPNAAVTPVEPGNYRIEIADQDDATRVQVRNGAAQITGARQDFKLRSGEQLNLRGGPRLTAEFDELSRPDEFDQWSNERNDRAERVAAARYVSPDVIGYEDLDGYGSWRHYDDYGDVWIPTRINSGWAPYRFGHWAWVSPWGWTWIDDAPWGFAPFHYGRWAMLDRRWCWVPGPRNIRAVYAPALVTWVGTPGVNVSINIGRQPVGWIPLGPREVYRPYYRGSHDYITRVNLSNTRIDNNEFERDFRRQPHDNDYRNHGALSVVEANSLRNAQPVGRNLIRGNSTRQLQPLIAQPVARPERNEASEPGPDRQFTPPVTPNTRPVITRRDQDNRNDFGRNTPRDQAPRDNDVRFNSPSAPPTDNPRMNDANRQRGRDGNGGGTPSDGTRPSFRNSPSPADQPRSEPRIPTERDPRFTNPPATPRSVTPTPQPERPAGAPVPTPTPETPRVRHDFGIRDETQMPQRREAVHPNNDSPPAVHMDRQRDMRVPTEPAPTRVTPAQPEPRAMSPRTPNNPEPPRPRAGGDDHDRQGRDGDKTR